ncbi:hypothetical protein MYP_1772 [Sporocytophaga myxococcoides]|uniref:Uncharacterized protein n=1 Tax=Sporocytophaga myxococcoides TaxID=153721 RepID=A0A098LDM4_9BACT|nr:hypothetical protein MYP_1772 [Sporocytophaga myxococcoides]
MEKIRFSADMPKEMPRNNDTSVSEIKALNFRKSIKISRSTMLLMMRITGIFGYFKCNLSFLLKMFIVSLINCGSF